MDAIVAFICGGVMSIGVAVGTIKLLRRENPTSLSRVETILRHRSDNPMVVRIESPEIAAILEQIGATNIGPMARPAPANDLRRTLRAAWTDGEQAPNNNVDMVDHFGAMLEELFARATENVGVPNVVEPNVGGMNGAQRVNALIDHNVVVANDDENVHDPVVTEYMRSAVEKLIESQINVPLDASTTMEEILEFAASSDDVRLKPVIRTLVSTLNGSVYMPIGITDMELLARVWHRSKDERNASSSELIKLATCVAMIDCVRQTGDVECVGGRCARFLSALVTLDYDPATWALCTYDQHKANIFKDAKDTINELANDWTGGTDPTDVKVGEMYAGDGAILEEPISDAEMDAIRDREKIFCQVARAIVMDRANAYFEKEDVLIPNRLQERIRDDIRALV